MATSLQPSPYLSSAGGAVSASPNATPEVLPFDTDNPAIPHPAYARMQPRWQKCRDLMQGAEAIRAGGETYLPKFAIETDDDYAIRVQLAGFYNGFSRVVLASVGMLMQQEPVLSDDMPQELKDMWENADGKGTHGAVLTAELIQSAIIDGHNGLLTDYENADATTLDRSKASAAAVPGTTLSADDEARIGLRPYFILVKADDIIKQLYQPVAGVRTLVLLVLRENIDERIGQFGVIGRVRYRVYTNIAGVVEYQLWENPIGSVRPVLIEGPRRMRNVSKIPWSPNRPGRKLSDVETLPVLMDLADMNIEHHQTKTNLLHLETRACVPTLVRIGAQPDANGNYPEVILGPGSTIDAPIVPNVAQPIYWLSPDVTVLEPARKTLEATEAAMGAMGLAFLAPQVRATETAQAKRIDSTAQNATLTTVGRASQDCIELAFGFAGEFIGVKAGSVAVNNEFENLLMDPQTMMAYVNAVANAGLPPRLLIEAWQASGRIPDDLDPDEILMEMQANAIAIADQAALDAKLLADKQKNGNQPPGPIPAVA